MTKKLDPSGTSLMGYVDAGFKEIVEVFGEPNGKHDRYKTDAEWIFMTPHGVATIYNYKTGRNYNGPKAPPVEEIRDWHVGGKDRAVVAWVHDKLKHAGRLSQLQRAETDCLNCHSARELLQNWSEKSKKNLSEREEYVLDRGTLSKLCEIFGLWPS